MASAAVSRQGLNQISSFGFSGAGFLTCYHLGVAHCLLKHGLMLGSGELPNESSPTITGVSGGALVATAVSVGISPHDGMNATLEIAKRARQEGGLLDHLQPGYVVNSSSLHTSF